MGGSSSSSQKTSSTKTTNVNSTFDGEQNYQMVNSSNNDITFTDYGAIDRTFDSFDNVVASNGMTVNSAIAAVGKTTDSTVAALKEFATTITTGDVQGSKWIALAIVAAVLIGIIFFIWKT